MYEKPQGRAQEMSAGGSECCNIYGEVSQRKRVVRFKTAPLNHLKMWLKTCLRTNISLIPWL